MKLDNRDDAIREAQNLLRSGASEDDLADALLEAHLEGLDQGRHAAANADAAERLTRRREFVLGQMKKDTAGLRIERF